jgi:hypothetical protein
MKAGRRSSGILWIRDLVRKRSVLAKNGLVYCGRLCKNCLRDTDGRCSFAMSKASNQRRLLKSWVSALARLRLAYSVLAASPPGEYAASIALPLMLCQTAKTAVWSECTTLRSPQRGLLSTIRNPQMVRSDIQCTRGRVKNSTF